MNYFLLSDKHLQKAFVKTEQLTSIKLTSLLLTRKGELLNNYCSLIHLQYIPFSKSYQLSCAFFNAKSHKSGGSMTNGLFSFYTASVFHILSIGVYLVESDEIRAVFPYISSDDSMLIAMIFLKPSTFTFPLIKQ